MRRMRVVVTLAIGLLAIAGRLAAGRQAIPEQIVVAVPNDIVSLDSHAHSGFPTRMRMEGAIEETLVRLGTQAEYAPALATAWRVVNPTTGEFTVRPGVRFHNGEPLTAQTVKFSLDRCLAPETKCPRRGQLAEIKEIHAVNDATVHRVTKSPFAALQTALTYATIVPPRALQADPKAPQKAAIGTGPMRFAEWVEQPLPRHSLENLGRLRQAVTVGIMLEESMGHPADILRVAQLGAADAIHVKLPMLGGISMSRQIATICQAAGLGIQSGSSPPSGVGLAAVHQFAATLPNLVRGSHGSPLARTVDDIVVDPVEAYASAITLSDAPGLGVQVDWDQVEKYRVRD